MNRSGYLFLLIFFCIFNASCKKDRDEMPKPTVSGVWKGIFKTPSFSSDGKYLLILRSDSTLRIFNSFDTAMATSKSEGHWKITGTDFSSNYDLSSDNKHTTGSVNTQLNFIEGNWGASGLMLGKVYLFRQ
jgi:hypothetical protein